MSINYVPPRVAVTKLGVSTQTLERWLENGKIEGIFTQGRQRRYNLDSIIPVRRGNPADERVTLLYARVSSRGQKNDLSQQVEFLQSRYPNAEIITNIGSGLNFKRKGLQTLLDRVLTNSCKLIVIAHKDQICRFGFDLISWLCARQQTEILVLNQTNLSPEREMVEDILAIIYVFSYRLYGLRKYKKQVTEDSELPSISSKGT
ncbi:IS607 family transposase [Nostoc sp. PCC 9305]|uniref:IS607 family transposase n=1 Tax=Nostoc sp. PCC 9305 TaxID=296636 RepID=UPI0039C74634